jgi:CheY-like chemotaxis protein
MNQMGAPRVLIVEDERIVALDLQRRLTRLGYVVLAMASSGEEAIQKAIEMPPDIVLMDIRLQGAMDGVEAAGHIRARLDIPIIYMTAYSDERTLQQAGTGQSRLFIRKPFEEKALRTTLQRALDEHQPKRL